MRNKGSRNCASEGGATRGPCRFHLSMHWETKRGRDLLEQEYRTILNFFLFLVVMFSRICNLTSTLPFKRSPKIELSSEFEWERICENSQIHIVFYKNLEIKKNPFLEGYYHTCIVDWFERLIIWFAIPLGGRFDLLITGSDLILITHFFPKH